MTIKIGSEVKSPQYFHCKHMLTSVACFSWFQVQTSQLFYIVNQKIMIYLLGLYRWEKHVDYFSNEPLAYLSFDVVILAQAPNVSWES